MYSTEDVWSNSQQHSQIQGQNKLCCGPQTIRDIEEMGQNIKMDSRENYEVKINLHQS